MLYVFLCGLAALIPAAARPRLGELAWARARLIVRTFAARQGLTDAQAWTQIIVEAAASAATFTPSRLAGSVAPPRPTPGAEGLQARGRGRKKSQ